MMCVVREGKDKERRCDLPGGKKKGCGDKTPLEVEAYSVNKKRGWNRLRKGRIVSEVGDGVRRKGWW